jgi:aspartyl protease family protein
MKTVTIGRAADNDTVIDDKNVSRKHLQITFDGTTFRAVDLNSTNGTFVNGKKIEGETILLPSDKVQIGTATLPWKSYFPEYKPVAINKSQKNNSWIWIASAGAAVLLKLLLAAIFLYFNGQKEEKPAKPQSFVVKMVEKNGVRYVPVKINGQELDFMFDTGASSICISTLEALVLIKNGTLTKDDIIGNEQFLDASGNVSDGTKINLTSVQIGDSIIHNIEATIIENPRAECLLGQTVLSHFGKYTIDNENNEIIFE